MKIKKENIDKGNLAIIIAVLLILSIIGYECYSVTHIELETQTANVTTLYNKIESKALFIRDEEAISNSSNGVTVPCVNDSSKIAVNGNVAMVFSSAEQAQDYSKLISLQKDLAHYVNLKSQSVGQAANLESINLDIEDKVMNYVLDASNGDVETASEDLNEILVRRQLLIGQKVDIDSVINSINGEISSLNSAQPSSFITTDESGVFTSYSDGLEGFVDYSKVEENTVKDFNNAVKSIDGANESNNNLGKLIKSFSWYIETVVPSDKVSDLVDGQKIEITLKDNNNIRLKAVIVSGAEPDVNQKETLLILKCKDMNPELAKLRYEDIEIILDSFDGFKIPANALHIVDDKKGVYVLIASQVRFREANVIYSDDDYVLIDYDETNEKGIHLYDKIITKGKDLQDGKVYT